MIDSIIDRPSVNIYKRLKTFVKKKVGLHEKNLKCSRKIRFIYVLHEAIELFALRISAFCLMPNYYHLLVQTPDGNLSRCMRHINGVYTQRFNRAHSLDGPLFKGRYKAILSRKIIICCNWSATST
ncbi:transposase [Desulfosarcina variabilis]|uniref:transposase n=1 Tax=Desulfosarcina variabilis TaxID=2300 RepID=UPI003AFA6C40